MRHDQPAFWLALAAVFAGNALLATWQSHWPLAALQAATAVLAVRAAFLLAAAQRRALDATDARPTAPDRDG